MSCLAWRELALHLGKQISFLASATEWPRHVVRAPAWKTLRLIKAECSCGWPPRGHPELQLVVHAVGGESWENWWGAAEGSYWHWSCAQHPALTGSSGTASHPLTDSWEPFPVQEHGRCPVSCVAPTAHPLCRSVVISDHSRRIQVTLIQVHFRPCPDLCVFLLGGCLLLIFSESLRIFVGAEEDRREGASEHAGSQRSTRGWCLQSKNALPLYTCLMQKPEGPGRWHLAQGSCFWGERSHCRITVMPFALLSKRCWVDWNGFSRREQRYLFSLLSRVNKCSSWYKDEQLNRNTIMTFLFTPINAVIPEGISNLALNSCSSS